MALDTDKIPQTILIAIVQAMGYSSTDKTSGGDLDRYKKEIAQLSWKGAFALWCQWHGFLGGWDDQFTHVINSLQDADVRVKKPVAISMTFDDLRRKGKSISPSMEHINMTAGSLHAGSTFPGKIYLDADSREFLQMMFEADLQVVFWVTPND